MTRWQRPNEQQRGCNAASLSLGENRVGALPATGGAVKSRSTDRRIDVAIDAETPIGEPKEIWLWIREAGRQEQLGRPSFIKTSLFLLTLLALIPAQTWANAQVKAYAEMICGTNLKTAETEDPEIKKRCMSGLMRLGKKALRVSGSSIQRCKDKADFFGCISGHTSDASRLARAAREHAVEIRSISLTPHHLYSPRLEELGQTIKDVLGPRSIIWSNNSKTFGCKGRNLYGYYNIPRGFVVMCQGFHKGDFNELVDTLKHEGWHAVQQQCRNGVPFLSQQQIASRISRQDAFNVHNYHPKQQTLESEARIMAKVNDKNWMRLVKQECRGKHKKRYTNSILG